MKSLVLTLSLLALIGGAVSAQIWLEPFNYTGTTLGSWAEYLGDWQAVNNTAESEQKGAYQYLVQPNRVYQDCAVECLVYYNPNSINKLQFGGVTLRCVNPAGGTDLVHIKIQDNNSSGDFDRVYVYDRPGSSVYADPTTPTTKARVRLLAIDSRLVGQADANLNGLWDIELNKTSALTLKSGAVGLCAYGGAQMDDFVIFDAVMLNSTASPAPQPGSALKFVMRGKAGAAYQAATSFGNSGIVLPDGRVIPLAPDALFFTSVSGFLPSVFANYANFLDINGDGSVKVMLPNLPALVGITIFNGFVTYDASGILQISNDHQVTIVP